MDYFIRLLIGGRMAILQVKSLDDQLYKALGIRAAMENRSISQEVTAIIREYLSRPSAGHQDNTEQFLQLCGTWNDDRTEEEIAEEIRRSRIQTGKRSGDVF
jgi:hypothetical protein